MNNKVSNYRRYIGLTQNQMANNLKFQLLLIEIKKEE